MIELNIRILLPKNVWTGRAHESKNYMTDKIPNRIKKGNNPEFAAFCNILTNTPDKILENYVLPPMFSFNM